MKKPNIYFLSLFFCFQTLNGLAQSANDFERDFTAAAAAGFSPTRVDRLLERYSSLLLAFNKINQLANSIQGKQLDKFPLNAIIGKPVYKSAVPTLLRSKFAKNRLLGYLLLISAGDISQKDFLRQRMLTEKSPECTLWLGMGLMHLGYQCTSVLFPWVASNNQKAGRYLFPMYCALAKDSLRQTGYQYASSPDLTERVYAIQSLAYAGYSKRSDAIVKAAISSWPLDLKGYAIFSAKAIRCDSLLPLLQPVLDSTAVRKIALEALADSPTASDRQFVKTLASLNRIDNEAMQALHASHDTAMLKHWLVLLPNYQEADQYYFSLRTDSLLQSNKMLPFLVNCLPAIRNPQILSQILPALAGRTDSVSQNYLIRYLRYSDASVRFYATTSLVGNCTDELATNIANILQDRKFVTANTFDLALGCQIDTLQAIAREIYHSDCEHMTQMDALTYLSRYPEKSDLALFRSIIKDRSEDGFIASRLAAQGLAELGDATAVKDIIQASEQERKDSDSNCLMYLQALSKLKGEHARKYIISFSKSDNIFISELVKSSLANW